MVKRMHWFICISSYHFSLSIFFNSPIRLRSTRFSINLSWLFMSAIVLHIRIITYLIRELRRLHHLQSLMLIGKDDLQQWKEKDYRRSMYKSQRLRLNKIKQRSDVSRSDKYRYAWFPFIHRTSFTRRKRGIIHHYPSKRRWRCWYHSNLDSNLSWKARFLRYRLSMRFIMSLFFFSIIVHLAMQRYLHPTKLSFYCPTVL